MGLIKPQPLSTSVGYFNFRATGYCMINQIILCGSLHTAKIRKKKDGIFGHFVLLLVQRDHTYILLVILENVH